VYFCTCSSANEEEEDDGNKDSGCGGGLRTYEKKRQENISRNKTVLRAIMDEVYLDRCRRSAILCFLVMIILL